eukprot:gnl/MRDRNA2_/MRDRNA2_89869_c0_seq1.p1 gnl/MRDRNA2_/MRDRNA2_89869_c0~~gnl/MRDRNA2_/MRDRNA2_89869_c0_seq1.p1  ORF type:complete len:131 (-),score=44.76 gnl/MRDRNA2_/MRDRNA2_89869_c0_seq1:44-436(-)
MGAEDDEDVDDQGKEEAKSKDSAKEAKNLDKVTDYVEDYDAKVDTKDLENRLADLRKKKEEQDREKLEREKKLAAVKIKKEDLDLMCSELPLYDQEVLERALREKDGNVMDAMRHLVSSFPEFTGEAITV